MSNLEFHPEQAICDGLLQMDKQELLQFVSRLCLHLKAEVGSRVYRGGIFPENICTDGQGHFALGPAKMEKWSGQELEFVAPELYWHGVCSPASDVYSLALLVFYGLNEGRLPFDTATASGQLARMSGKALPTPRTAGKRLSEVLEKATAFRAEERYQSPEELQILLESCMDNKYLGGSSGAEAVFRKEDGELSEIERMMVDIIERGQDQEEDPEEQPPVLDESLSPEEMAGLVKPDCPPQEKEDINAAVEEFFGSLSGQDEELPPPDEEEETVRLYEPSREKKERSPIPILTEEKYPELEPVVLKQQPHRLTEEEDEEEPEVPAEPEDDSQLLRRWRKQRTLALVLILCLLLVAGALAVNLFWHRDQRYPQAGSTAEAQRMNEPPTNPPAEPTQDPLVLTIPTDAPQLPRYRVLVSDASWSQAEQECLEQGGHLAVITSQEELYEIAHLAEQMGITKVWIGCRRVNGQLVWETDEDVSFFCWGQGEPSRFDYYDLMPEDYLMIYREGDQWYYNDNRNDPAGDFPNFYSGIMGYALEFER